MHFKEDLPIQFEQLWRYADIPKTTAQNWTNGRPYQLRPSISEGEGKGSRNLYALADCLVLKFLWDFHRGLSPAVMQNIVEFFNSRPKGKPPALTLFRDDRSVLRVTWMIDQTVEIDSVGDDAPQPNFIPDGRLYIEVNIDQYRLHIWRRSRADLDSGMSE